jgi:hypothetical protein
MPMRAEPDLYGQDRDRTGKEHWSKPEFKTEASAHFRIRTSARRWIGVHARHAVLAHKPHQSHEPDQQHTGSHREAEPSPPRFLRGIQN